MARVRMRRNAAAYSESISWSWWMTAAAAAGSSRSKAVSDARIISTASRPNCRASRAVAAPGRKPFDSLSASTASASFLASSAARSSSVTTLSMANTARRSCATGWRLAITCNAASSISASYRLILRSRSSTSVAIERSQPEYALTASCTWSMTSAPMATACTCSDDRSPSNARAVWSSRLSDMGLDESAEATRDVVFGELVSRIREDAIGLAHFDEITEVEVRRALRHARGLLHRVRDDHDRVALAQFLHEIFDSRGRDRIERRARLVHEDHFGVHGDRARDAQALLLATRQRRSRGLQPVLHLFPESCALQRTVNDLVEFDAVTCEPVNARTVGDVLVDGFRKRIRLLENHADTRTQLHDVLLPVVDVLAVEQDRAFDSRTLDGVVHAVEAAQERGLAAAGRPDHRQHLLLADVDADLLDGVLRAVIHVHVAAAEDGIVDGDVADGRPAVRIGRVLQRDRLRGPGGRLQIEARSFHLCCFHIF